MLQILNLEFEFVTLALLRKLAEADEAIVLMSSDDEFIKSYGRVPQKPLDERVILALSVEGVSAVVVDGKEIFLPDDCECEEKKEFEVGYVPGTYDLLHAGHIENILYARKCCEQVVLGVNADSLVWENKKKHTYQTEETRRFVLSHLKGVSLVMIVHSNDKKEISDTVRRILGSPVDVIILGEDLKDKDSINRVGLPAGVKIVYTRRTPEMTERRSSTAERKQIQELQNQVERLEAENEHLRNLLMQIREQVEED